MNINEHVKYAESIKNLKVGSTFFIFQRSSMNRYIIGYCTYAVTRITKTSIFAHKLADNSVERRFTMDGYEYGIKREKWGAAPDRIDLDTSGEKRKAVSIYQNRVNLRDSLRTLSDEQRIQLMSEEEVVELTATINRIVLNLAERRK